MTLIIKFFINFVAIKRILSGSAVSSFDREASPNVTENL